MSSDGTFVVENGRRYQLIKQHTEVRNDRGDVIDLKWTHMALVPCDDENKSPHRNGAGGGRSAVTSAAKKKAPPR
jgi:hypothetical protein